MKSNRGQGLLEILLAVGLSALVLPTLFLGFMTSREGKAQQQQRLVAIPLLVEAEEAVRNVREKGWTEFAAYQHNVAYHPETSNGHWVLTSGSETINGLQRQIVLTPVYRDANDTIVMSGGILDPSTLQATITVSWSQPSSSAATISIYLTRHTNQTHTETTDIQFDQGTKTSVAITKSSDGEVILGATGGYGDWCNPTLLLSALDLPKNGVANAISAINGQIAAGTGENSSGVSYANIVLNDPPYPTQVTASISGTFDGYKTNDVFVEQDYAYLGTDNNSKEVVIIDLTQLDDNNKYLQAGYYNLPSNGSGNTIYVADTIGYVTNANKLYSFDLSSKSGSRPSLDADGVTLPGVAIDVVVINNRAYVVIDSLTNQLVIVDVSTPSSLTIADQVTVSGGAGRALYINKTATRAYVATNDSASQREFFIIDADSASATYKQTLSSYDTNGMTPKGVVTVSGPRAIIIGTNAEEYQVVNITNETLTLPNLLPRCGGMNVDTGINGISTVFTPTKRSYSYIITGDSTTELKIIEGGPGLAGGLYSLSGIFESQTFDATASSQVAYNHFFSEVNIPSAVTDIKMQIAVADPIGSSCSGVSFAFVGPDKTASTYFTSADTTTIKNQIPLDNDGVGYENPGRCFRYKAFLSTQDETLTPILNALTVNFSP